MCKDHGAISKEKGLEEPGRILRERGTGMEEALPETGASSKREASQEICYFARVAGQISHFVTSSGEFRKHVLFKTLGIAIYVSFDETDFRRNK